jgi:hypothetical protein
VRTIFTKKLFDLFHVEGAKLVPQCVEPCGIADQSNVARSLKKLFANPTESRLVVHITEYMGTNHLLFTKMPFFVCLLLEFKDT